MARNANLPPAKLAIYIRVQLQVSTAVFPLQLTANPHGRATEDSPNAWVSELHHLEFLAPALILAAIWGLIQKMKDTSLSLCFSNKLNN